MERFTGRVTHLFGMVYSVSAYNDSGQEAYYVLRVEPGKEESFRKAMSARGMVDCSQFGNLVASGFGYEPDPYTMAMLKAAYEQDAVA